MSNNETNPLQIPSNLVKTVKLQGRDTLNEKYQFDLIGTNGYIEIEPKIVKFTGFELGKLNITKVKIINTASKPQRVHILPPTTPFFSIKYDKKGQLVPGMSEDVYIHFMPGEHKYYFDTIRVHTESDQLQIPIHAYPVMNRENIKDIFPKLVDFGTCPIGTTQIMRFPLTCKIPLNFEYEFISKKENSDITISPAKGIVPGKGSVEIEVIYTPSNPITVIAEYELNLSQFDFEPFKVKIVGSGKLKDKDSENRESRDGKKRTKLGKLDTIRISTVDQLKLTSEKVSESLTTFLNMKDMEKTGKDIAMTEEEAKSYKPLMTQKARLKEEPIPEEKKSVMFDSTKLSTQQIQMNGTLNPRQALEKQFLDRFNQVAHIDKEKQIKFFKCVGDPIFTKQDEEVIINERAENRKNFLDNYENNGITRYSLSVNQDYPVIGEVFPIHAPTYDLLKNDDIRKRRQIIHKIVSVASKIILRRRAELRLNKIKQTLKGARTREEVKAIVNQDWQRAEYFGVGKKDYIQFAFEFNINSIVDLRLPIQLENSAANLSYKFELNQRIGFDDFAPIDPLPFSDLEVMGYRIINPPAIINYPPIEAERKNRKGAEEEYSISGPYGPYEKVSDTRELIDPVPSNLLKPFNVESHRFVCPHPSLKTLSTYFETVETDPEFELKASKVTFQDSLDPTFEADYDILKREFLSSAPGMEGERHIAPLPLEITNYFTHKLTLTYDFGFEDRWEKDCPDIMDKPYEEDHYTDSDSDDQHSIELDTAELDEFIDILEKEDPKIKDVKKKNETDIHDEIESTGVVVNKNLEIEKDAWSATLSTKVYECDKNIVNKENLINLL